MFFFGVVTSYYLILTSLLVSCWSSSLRKCPLVSDSGICTEAVAFEAKGRGFLGRWLWWPPEPYQNPWDTKVCSLSGSKGHPKAANENCQLPCLVISGLLRKMKHTEPTFCRISRFKIVPRRACPRCQSCSGAGRIGLSAACCRCHRFRSIQGELRMIMDCRSWLFNHV